MSERFALPPDESSAEFKKKKDKDKKTKRFPAGARGFLGLPSARPTESEADDKTELKPLFAHEREAQTDEAAATRAANTAPKLGRVVPFAVANEKKDDTDEDDDSDQTNGLPDNVIPFPVRRQENAPTPDPTEVFELPEVVTNDFGSIRYEDMEPLRLAEAAEEDADESENEEDEAAKYDSKTSRLRQPMVPSQRRKLGPVLPPGPANLPADVPQEQTDSDVKDDTPVPDLDEQATIAAIDAYLDGVAPLPPELGGAEPSQFDNNDPEPTAPLPDAPLPMPVSEPMVVSEVPLAAAAGGGNEGGDGEGPDGNGGGEGPGNGMGGEPGGYNEDDGNVPPVPPRPDIRVAEAAVDAYALAAPTAELTGMAAARAGDAIRLPGTGVSGNLLAAGLVLEHILGSRADKAITSEMRRRMNNFADIMQTANQRLTDQERKMNTFASTATAVAGTAAGAAAGYAAGNMAPVGPELPSVNAANSIPSQQYDSASNAERAMPVVERPQMMMPPVAPPLFPPHRLEQAPPPPTAKQGRAAVESARYAQVAGSETSAPAPNVGYNRPGQFNQVPFVSSAAETTTADPFNGVALETAVPNTNFYAETNTRPAVMMEQVAQTAEQNTPMEHAYERRQEVMDEASYAGAQTAGGATSVGSILGNNYQPAAASARQLAETQAYLSMDQQQSAQPKADYAAAVRGGFSAAMVIIIVAAIAYFLFG